MVTVRISAAQADAFWCCGRRRYTAMFDAAFDDVIRSPFPSQPSLASQVSEDKVTDNLKPLDVRASMTPTNNINRFGAEASKFSFADIANARLFGQKMKHNLESTVTPPSTRRLSMKLSQMFSSVEDHVFLRIFQDHSVFGSLETGGTGGPAFSQMQLDAKSSVAHAGEAYLPIQKAIQAVISEQVEQVNRLQAGEEVSAFMDCPIDAQGASNGKATFKISLRIRGVFSRVRCAAGSFVGTGLSLFESPVNSAVYVLGGQSDHNARTDADEDEDAQMAQELKHNVGALVYRQVQTQAFASMLTKGMRLMSIAEVPVVGMNLEQTLSAIRTVMTPSHNSKTRDGSQRQKAVVLRFSGPVLDAALDSHMCVKAALRLLHRLESFANPDVDGSQAAVTRATDALSLVKASITKKPDHRRRRGSQILGLSPLHLRNDFDSPRHNAPVDSSIATTLEVEPEIDDAFVFQSEWQNYLTAEAVPKLRQSVQAVASGAADVLKVVDCVQKLIHVRCAQVVVWNVPILVTHASVCVQAQRVLPVNNMAQTFVETVAKEVEDSLRSNAFGLFRPLDATLAQANSPPLGFLGRSELNAVNWWDSIGAWLNDSESSTGVDTQSIASIGTAYSDAIQIEGSDLGDSDDVDAANPAHMTLPEIAAMRVRARVRMLVATCTVHVAEHVTPFTIVWAPTC